MITVRKRVLKSIKTGIDEINQLNGYKNNFNGRNVQYGIVKSTDVKNFPTVCVELGTERAIDFSEDRQLPIMELDCFIVVYNNKTDLETTENIIEDFLSYFNQNGNENITVISDLNNIPYLSNYKIAELSPYSNMVKNITTIGFLLKIIYVDVIELDSIQHILTQALEILNTESGRSLIIN